MTTMDPVTAPGAADDTVGVEPYLNACRRRGIGGIVRVVQELREEISARRGEIEFEGEGNEWLVGVQVVRDGRYAYVTAPTDEPAEAVIERAAAVLHHMPDVGAAVPGKHALPAGHGHDSGEVGPLAAHRGSLLRDSAGGPGDKCEIRCVQRTRQVRIGTTEGSDGSYRTSRASLELRFTHEAGGRVANIMETDHAPDASTVLTRFDAGLRDETLRRARLLTDPRVAEDLPDRVILDAHVGAQLVKFLAVSFSAEAVAQGRSRLAGLTGRRIAADCVTFTDDPLDPALPLAAPFDDEGEPAQRRELVTEGRLNALAGSRRYLAGIPGAVPGCAWQQSSISPPRPGVRNFWLRPGTEPLGTGTPALRIIQIRGMYTSNEVTGDFSMGATGLVESGGEQVPTTTRLTLAGNVFDLLEQVVAVGDDLHWSGGNAGTYGAPSLEVRGLSVGV